MLVSAMSCVHGICEYGWGSIKQIVPLYSMECPQVEHMPGHIVKDNVMPAI